MKATYLGIFDQFNLALLDENLDIKFGRKGRIHGKGWGEINMIETCHMKFSRVKFAMKLSPSNTRRSTHKV